MALGDQGQGHDPGLEIHDLVHVHDLTLDLAPDHAQGPDRNQGQWLLNFILCDL